MPLPTDLFDAPTTKIPAEQAAALASELFGVTGTAEPLAGERDQNFHLRAKGGADYVFKIHASAEDPAVVEMQIGALQHLAKTNPAIAVPRVILSRSGTSAATVDLGSGPQIARLLSYVPGVQMEGFRPLSAARLRSLGAQMALLDQALQGYEHPAASYILLWDVQHTAQMRPLLPHIPDADIRALTARCLDRFEADVQPRLAGMRSQIIHNDCNPNNVLYDAAETERVSGFLDFGDMVRAPLVCELAVAAAYHLRDGDDPLSATRHMVGAYHAVVPLTTGELELLADLILARVVLRVTIACWRASLKPEEREERLAGYPGAARRLQQMAQVNSAEAARALLAACGG